MLRLRTDIPYAASTGKLTQAGVEAIQGQFDAQATTAAGLNTRLSAVETELAGSLINLQTAVAASGTEVDFTGIPSWVSRITVMGIGISTNGADRLVLRVGDGAIVDTGYLGSVSNVPNGASPSTGLFTSGCGLVNAIAAASVYRFTCHINRFSGNTWAFSGTGAFSDGATTTVFASEVALSGALDRLRLTTTGGANTFDAGSVNISWE